MKEEAEEEKEEKEFKQVRKYLLIVLFVHVYYTISFIAPKSSSIQNNDIH